MPHFPTDPAGLEQKFYNSRLTTFATAFSQGNNWIADQVFPIQPVEQQSGVFNKQVRNLKARGQIRTPGAASPEVGWTVAEDTYFCDQYSLAHRATEEDIKFYQGQDLMAKAAEIVTDELLRGRDLNFVNQFMKTGVWATDVTGVSGAPANATQFAAWNRIDADPIANLNTWRYNARIAGSAPLDTLVIGVQAWDNLRNSPMIRDRVKYTQTMPGLLTEDLVAATLGLRKVVVNETLIDTANDGAPEAAAFLKPNDALLVASGPAGMNTTAAGVIFSWTGLLNAGATGVVVDSWDDQEQLTRKVRARMAYGMKVLNPAAGVYLQSVTV